MEASDCFNPCGRGPGTHWRKKRLCWSQILSGHFWRRGKYLLSLSGFKLCMVHTKPSHYTDYTILDLPTIVFGSLINTKAIFILLQLLTKLLRPERTYYYLYIINRFWVSSENDSNALLLCQFVKSIFSYHET